jgi:hypothetical protein
VTSRVTFRGSEAGIEAMRLAHAASTKPGPQPMSTTLWLLSAVPSRKNSIK